MFDISPILNQPFRTFVTAKNSKIDDVIKKIKNDPELKRMGDVDRSIRHLAQEHGLRPRNRMEELLLKEVSEAELKAYAAAHPR